MLIHILIRVNSNPCSHEPIAMVLSFGPFSRCRRRENLYIKLMAETGQEKAFPEVLATLLNEILRIIPAADAIRIRLLECPLPGRERRLVPGLGIKRMLKGSSISPIYTGEPEVAVRSLGDSIVGYVAETRQIQRVADL